MPKGQNDFHHANVDQTVLFESKDTIVERDPIVQTLPENNLSRNYRNFENPRTKKRLWKEQKQAKNISNIQPAGLTFKCSNCSMVFDNHIVYRLHLKDATRCKHCSFTSCTKAGLKAHEKEEEEKQLKELNEVLYEKARVFLATYEEMSISENGVFTFV